MSVFKRRGSPYYQYDFLFAGRRCWGSTKLTNRVAAQRYESKLRERLAKTRGGVLDLEPPPLFRDFAAQFLERTKNEMRPNTSRCYRTSLGLRVDEAGKRQEREDGLLAWFGGKRLNEIHADDIERFKQMRLEQTRPCRTGRKKLSPPTINRDLACIRRILLYAVKLDVITTTPFVAHKVKFLKESGHERILSFEEERRYLSAARQPLRDVAMLMLELGLRPEEACAIRREDVHGSAVSPYLHIPGGKTKNAKRDVPLTRQAKELLGRRCSAAKGECIFPMRVGNGFDWSCPMSEIHPAHYDALKESKIQPRFRPYDLRHTYGTRAIEGSTDVLTLMRLMGHADLKTTARYVHLSKRHLAEAQEKMEQYRAVREIAEAEARKSAMMPSTVGIAPIQ
jgi:integrase